MRLRREAGLGVGVVLALQIVLSVLTITLLQRMGPAIEHILEENVEMTQAVEEMLGALAARRTDPTAKSTFEAALSRARSTVTQPGVELPLLDRVTTSWEAAFLGDAQATRRVVEALLELGELNREAMIAADRGAKRLGQVGAWSAVILGALALGLGILVYRRLRLHLELPIEGVRSTLQHVREGNMQARCATGEGPAEVRQIARDVNWLLDQLLQRSEPAVHHDHHRRDQEVRRVLAWLLDRSERPMIVVDGRGHVVAANRPALGPDLPPPPVEGEKEGPWRTEAISETGLRVAWLEAAGGSPASVPEGHA